VGKSEEGKEKRPKAFGPATVAKPAAVGAIVLVVVDAALGAVL